MPLFYRREGQGLILDSFKKMLEKNLMAGENIPRPPQMSNATVVYFFPIILLPPKWGEFINFKTKTPESEKAKTLRIARFLSQKLSG